MNMPSKPKLHPVLWVAAVSVIVLSLAGVGAITGLIPTVGSKPGEPAPPTAAGTPATGPDATPATAPVAAESAPGEAPKPAAHHHPSHPAPIAQNAAQPPVAPPVCRDCGTIERVRAVEVKGEGTGLGAVGGAVVGGLLGSTVGKGHGKDAATIVGAVGGGFAGNAIEKNVRKKTHYEIVVRFDDGTTKSYTQETQPSWRDGERVRVVDGRISPLN